MVNTGKPSKGCYLCRARRIKCDEGKPGCMRCQKVKRVCPGYRDVFDLNLRDETKSTKQKLNNRMIINARSSDSSQDIVNGSRLAERPEIITDSSSFGIISPTSDTSSWMSPASAHHHGGVICSQISTPIDQQATCFFLANFVLLPAQNTMRGYFDFILPLLKGKPDPCLSLAFAAVATASLGTRPNSKALLPQADLFYVKALTKINATLRDARTASSDSTLAAVLLLSFFEQVTSPRISHQAWNSHVDGAVALLKARGPENFQTRRRRDIWHVVRALATIQYIANSKAVVPSVDWWMTVSASDVIVAKFARLNLLVADLRSENTVATSQIARTAANIEYVLSVQRKAEALEKEYTSWFESLPPKWQPKFETWLGDRDIGYNYATSETHPGRIDSYSEMWIAYHQNIARSSQILLHFTILRCVAWLGDMNDYTLTPEYAKAQQVCRPLIEDIVASCPYFFGWNKDRNEAMVDQSFFACGESGNTDAHANPKALWGIFIMWPIFVAGSADFALPSQRMYLRGRLQYISELMGIHQASVLLKAPLGQPSIYIYGQRQRAQAFAALAKATQPSAQSKSPENIDRSARKIQV
ncbi:White-opaque regulator [Lachnellula occidentalis]|uniref:White-opaque regulator n=1 Tax=Lachnellula occidentalis TaxID=215460 RepID=A0A8H8UDB1_9HELO|nr:White-opaque regulator [Lachnellula occidentalis]